MNTANLQLEGLLVALAELSRSLVRAGAMPADALAEGLGRAQQTVLSDDRRKRQLSDAQVEAMLFPIRYLALASRPDAERQSFAEIAAAIGRSKPDREP